MQSIELDEHIDPRGWLGVVPTAKLPFKIERIFFIRDVPKESVRGGHANRNCHELLICLAGQVTIATDDGVQKREVTINSASQAIYIPPMTWVTLSDFAEGTVIAVAASHPFDLSEKLDQYADFRKRLND